MFKILVDDDNNDDNNGDDYTINSPCEPGGSGELKSKQKSLCKRTKTTNMIKKKYLILLIEGQLKPRRDLANFDERQTHV